MRRAFHLTSLLLLAPCAPQTLFAQQTDLVNYVVVGTVTDWVTHKGIAAATVVATDSHNVTHATLSAADGSYRIAGLPPEPKVNLACSQLGYSPNPTQKVVEIKDGVGKWDTRLFSENTNSDYLKSAATQLSALTGPDGIAEARFVVANINPAAKKAIAEELHGKMGAAAADPGLAEMAAVFDLEAPDPSQTRQLLKRQLSTVVATQETGFTMTFDVPVTAAGNAALTASTKASLSKVATILQGYPDLKLEIGDSYDGLGWGISEKTLSAKRVYAVRDYLATQGLRQNNLNILGWGKTPVTNDDPAGRSQGRLVKVYITGDAIGLQQIEPPPPH